MVVAKNPGIGRGRGGGRPPGKSTRPPREVEEVRLRLSPQAAELLRAAAEAGKVPTWRVVEAAILAAHDRAPGSEVLPAAPGPGAGPALPPDVQKIAQEAASFLEAHQDRPAALKALRRAWKQALALARHDLPDQR